MDGTLIDSEPYWIEAETALVRQFGGQWSEQDGLSLVGLPLIDSAVILQSRGVDMPSDEIVHLLTGQVAAQVGGQVPWLEDAYALLHLVHAEGIPCALVTMSYATMADALVAQAPGTFDAVVTGDQVSNGKPHPEAYLTASERLGVDPRRCVAIEDSPAGIGSAVASGARTIGVKRHVDIPRLPGLSRVRSLDGWDVSRLSQIASGTIVDELG